MLCFYSCKNNENPDFSTIAAGFKTPPDSVQTSVYWYWISDNLSKEGVEKDLEAMKRVGINRAFIGNIGLPENETQYGEVKLFSDEWWEITHAALKKATELNIEIGMFNSPGWSQSGGPWVKPEQAMRYLAKSENVFRGPKKVSEKLGKPAGDFEDVKVVAFRAPKDYGKTLSELKPQLSSRPTLKGLQQLIDKNHDTELLIPEGAPTRIDLQSQTPYTARSFTVYPAKRNMRMDVVLEIKENNGYRQLKKFTIDRSNNEINVGFEPYAPVIVSFPEVASREFRVTFENVSQDAGVAEVEIASTPRVERIKEKSLAKMHPTPLPYWHDYQWEEQATIVSGEHLIQREEVLDITDHLSSDGMLNWDVPEGEWVVLRTGMLPTGAKNGPASVEGTGLEIDKLNHQHAIQHFDAFMGEILRRIPAEDRRTFKVAVQDSYEMGGQNWTDDFIEKFKKQFGYDPLPFIPVLYGNVVESQDDADRFLWDLRRFVADNVAYEYVGGLRDVSHKHGLTIWLENYGHWGFPGEFLQYGGQSDEVGGEFWSEGELGDIENRAASSAAHIYGKRKVSAESFTAAGNTFGRYPAMMKQRGDRFFAEGINNTLLHVYIHQAYEDKQPGVNAWFGNEFNRFNTWYDYMDDFTAYLKRANFMLQQGTYVADVAYFIGEDVPKMTGVQDPSLPKGYDFDYINAEIILNRLQVEDGKFVLPDGLSYSILVLPQLQTMRPELLERISDLVKAGGTILGPRPQRSPSLQHGEQADQQVQKLGEQLWGNIDGKEIKANKVGKGLVLDGMDLTEAFEHLQVRPDVLLDKDDATLFIHRTLPDGEIYFISNQLDSTIHIEPIFRVKGKQPEWWNAIDGSIRDLPEFKASDSGIQVPLQLAPFESAFVIFRKALSQESGNLGVNFPKPLRESTLDTGWKLSFDSTIAGSAITAGIDQLIWWNEHPNDSIRYFAGKAHYQQDFELEQALENGNRLWLDLGELVAMAKVKVNGKEVGGLWTPPYRIDISDYVETGKNSVEISVANTWKNRLIGDLNLPEAERKTWTIVNPYKKEDSLMQAGLKGPVRLLVMP
ncbi:glycoside hydrolase family 2 [Olivibacter sp. SDN3]|nr:glycoside hydrolase family 2 [Olivibacter sp. SDN3]